MIISLAAFLASCTPPEEQSLKVEQTEVDTVRSFMNLGLTPHGLEIKR